MPNREAVSSHVLQSYYVCMYRKSADCNPCFLYWYFAIAVVACIIRTYVASQAVGSGTFSREAVIVTVKECSAG